MSRGISTLKSSDLIIGQGEQEAQRGDGYPERKKYGPSESVAGEAKGSGVKIAAIYARVSTDKQEKEQTINSQLSLLREAVQKNGDEVLAEYEFIDNGQSGATLDRPALERLRDKAYEQAFDVLYVYAPDRLAREYAYQFLLLKEFKSDGIEVVFLNHAFGSSPTEQMLLQMQGVFAEYERAQITERTRRGRLYAARQGRYMCGRGSYGYTYVAKSEHGVQHLEINEKEAEVVRLIYLWLIQEQISSRAIAERLNSAGIATKTRQGKPWQQSTVSDILRNPTYKGEAIYNQTLKSEAIQPYMNRSFYDRVPGNKRSKKLRPEEEWIKISVPAIISEECWQSAQEQLKQNALFSKRNNKKREYLLRGLLVCAECGRHLAGRSGKYTCSGHMHSELDKRRKGVYVAASSIEVQVWEYISQLLGDDEVLRRYYEEQSLDPAINDPEEEERTRLQVRVRSLGTQEKRLLDGYQIGLIELDELQKRKQELREEGTRLNTRIEQIERGRLEREESLRVLEGVQTFCEGIRDTLTEPTFELKQKLLRLVVDKIVVKPPKITIHHIIPTTKVTLRTAHPEEK